MKLPPLYFSDHWYWEPDAVPMIRMPRRECWGGLLVALITLLVYTRAWRKDSLALRLGLWGFLAGALGFSLGQAVQATNAWNHAFFSESFVAPFTSHLNWWNTMETSFGAIMGGVLGLGVWVNRKRIQPQRTRMTKRTCPLSLNGSFSCSTSRWW